MWLIWWSKINFEGPAERLVSVRFTKRTRIGFVFQMKQPVLLEIEGVAMGRAIGAFNFFLTARTAGG